MNVVGYVGMLHASCKESCKETFPNMEQCVCYSLTKVYGVTNHKTPTWKKRMCYVTLGRWSDIILF